LTVKELKTTKSRRRVAIGSFALDALAAHRKRMLAEGKDVRTGLVFCDRKGGFLRKSNFQRRHFDKALERAGLPDIRPYDLRHTCATLLLLAGEDVKVVAGRLGHSTTVLTQNTYQHVLPGMQERAAAKLNAIFTAPRDHENRSASSSWLLLRSSRSFALSVPADLVRQCIRRRFNPSVDAALLEHHHLGPGAHLAVGEQDVAGAEQAPQGALRE
jgi:hypothetical protein